jgi:hypothetical protein
VPVERNGTEKVSFFVGRTGQGRPRDCAVDVSGYRDFVSNNDADRIVGVLICVRVGGRTDSHKKKVACTVPLLAPTNHPKVESYATISTPSDDKGNNRQKRACFRDCVFQNCIVLSL